MTIRTGIDIVSNKRIEKLLEKGRDCFYRRIFTEAEQAYLAEKNHDPATVAGMFAAKEAVSKLLGTGIGPIGWRDMEILHEDGGRPYLAPSRALYAAMEVMGISDIELSISNEEEFSVASGMGYV
jgi:holo-[acyl-carrier-protein] synthase